MLWDFVRDSAGLYQTNQDRYYEVEEFLGIDLNNDKIIGLNTKKLESKSKSTWGFKATEAIKGVNHFVTKEMKTESISLLEMDKNWSLENISPKSNILKDGEELFFKAENDFHLNLNYDGFYGNPVI